MASKLVLILDDLLWVLTDSQLKAMVQYAKSLSEAIEKSAEQRKSLASETAQVGQLIVSLYHYQVFHNTIVWLAVLIYFRECSVIHFNSAVYLKLHWGGIVV